MLPWQPISGQNCLTTFIWHTSILKQIGISQAVGWFNSTNDHSSSCNNLMNFGSLTPEITRLICELIEIYLITEFFQLFSKKLELLMSKNWHYWHCMSDVRITRHCWHRLCSIDLFAASWQQSVNRLSMVRLCWHCYIL